MKNYLLTTALAVIAVPAFAATTISTTLSMTSPSALISGTGPSATIIMTNGLFTNLSATTLIAANISSSSVSGTALVSNRIAKAHVVLNGAGCTVISGDATSCQKLGTGSVAVSLSTVLPTAIYTPQCGVRGNGNTAWWATYPGSISNTTTGFFVDTLAITGSTLTFSDANNIDCTIY